DGVLEALRVTAGGEPACGSVCPGAWTAEAISGARLEARGGCFEVIFFGFPAVKK
ncbi:hypothetical protein A2U01_0106146, partial [Trifolium medium]|nr:hypothetical protein [Trifolium medium]